MFEGNKEGLIKETISTMKQPPNFCFFFISWIKGWDCHPLSVSLYLSVEGFPFPLQGTQKLCFPACFLYINNPKARPLIEAPAHLTTGTLDTIYLLFPLRSVRTEIGLSGLDVRLPEVINHNHGNTAAAAFPLYISPGASLSVFLSHTSERETVPPPPFQL